MTSRRTIEGEFRVEVIRYLQIAIEWIKMHDFIHDFPGTKNLQEPSACSSRTRYPFWTTALRGRVAKRQRNLQTRSFGTTYLIRLEVAARRSSTHSLADNPEVLGVEQRPAAHLEKNSDSSPGDLQRSQGTSGACRLTDSGSRQRARSCNRLGAPAARPRLFRPRFPNYF